jgi:hypothetical protein
MSTAPISGPIQIANKTAAAWATQNPVLLIGQLGLETDTNKIKAGDGATAWNLLSYVVSTGEGDGVSAYVELTDAATAALPTTNAPLSAALALKATTAAVALKADTTAVTAGLAAKADDAATTAALATKVPTTRTINGAALSSNITLTKTDLSLGSVDNTSDLAKPVSTAQATAIALRAPGGTLITYTGTARSLASTDHGNIVRCTNASAVAITVPSGLPAGFSCLLVQGGAGVVTAVQGSGVTLDGTPLLVTDGAETDLAIVPSGTDAYTVYSPVEGGGATTLAELTDIASYNLGVGNTSVAAIKTTADAAQVASGTAEAAVDAVAAALAAGTHTDITVDYNDGAGTLSLAASGGSTLAVISGTRGTGNLLTATVAAGWTGTYQWQSYHTGAWNNVGSGGTSATHTELIADVARDIRCVFTPTTFASNTLAAPVVGGFSEDFTLGSNGDPLSGYAGSWQEFNGPFELYDYVGTKPRGMAHEHASFSTAWRDSSLFDGTFSATIRPQPVSYANLGARMDSTGDNGVFLVADDASATWKIQIYDTSGVLQTNYNTTVAFSNDTSYDIELVLSGTSVIGKVGGVQVGVTQTDSWSVGAQTYVGFGTNGSGAFGATFESISAA